MTTTEAPAIRRGIPLALSTHAAQPETPGALTVMMSVEEARSCVARIRVSFETMRRDLLELEEREGWKALGYDSWRACVQTEFGQSQAYLYRQLTAAKIEREMDSPIGEIPESHLRPLAALDSPEERRAAFDRAAEIAGEGKRTARHVQQAVRELAPAKADPLPDDDDMEEQRGERWTSTAHKAAEERDQQRLDQAEWLKDRDPDQSRALLNSIEVSTSARDRLLERLPVAPDARANWLEMGVTVMGAPFMAAFYASADHILAMLSDDPRVDDTAYAALSHAIGTARRVLEEA